MTPRIILDPGHGGADPGACLYHGTRLATTERTQNLLMCLSLKYVLQQGAGITPELTRTGDALPGTREMCKPELRHFQARTSGMGPCDAYVSVHYDWSGAPEGGIYYSNAEHQREASRTLADACAAAYSVSACNWSKPDTASRHKRLYIRDAHTNLSVMWEVEPIKETDRAYRLKKANEFAAALCAALGVPFRWVAA